MSGHDNEVLEHGSIADIGRNKRAVEEAIQFHWEYYGELAFQRKRIYEQLKSSLRDRATPFQVSQWQRIVRYKYSLIPLSTDGSLTDPGGRFNVGAIDPARYPMFPALYLASDKSTGMAEVLGSDTGSGLTAEEMALATPASITVVSVSGKLESVLDVRQEENLSAFTDLIKGFRLSRNLMSKAKRLGIQVDLITTAKLLKTNIQHINWRRFPVLLDVPAPCQIFGSIVMAAGIEAILYDSTRTSKPCLAVFPPNLANSESYVALDDEAPNGQVATRMDADTFRQFCTVGPPASRVQ